MAVNSKYRLDLLVNPARLRVASLGVLLCAVLSCSQAPELLQNNDPSKYSVVKDVHWASPGGFDLAMDIYTPNPEGGPRPVLVMFHGGGWLINNKSIMDQASAYIATNSNYVVCNVDYRLLADQSNTVTLNQIVEDAFGAVLWVKTHVSEYGGDSTRIAVTGDSAGGHLAAMVVNMGDQLSSSGFTAEPLGFNPSFLPEGKTAEDVARDQGLEVHAAILSYGAFDMYQSAQGGFEGLANPFWLMSGSIARGIFGAQFNVVDNPDLYRTVSPVHNIPSSTERQLPPQLFTAGSEDSLVTPASVKAYVAKVVSAGHVAEYWEHDGRPHAFLDSGSNGMLGISFEADAPPALDVMIAFLDSVFRR